MNDPDEVVFKGGETMACYTDESAGTTGGLWESLSRLWRPNVVTYEAKGPDGPPLVRPDWLDTFKAESLGTRV